MTSNAGHRVLFCYPWYGHYTGGPRHVVALIGALDRQKLDPVFVSQCASPLSRAVAALGVPGGLIALPGGPGLAGGSGHDGTIRRKVRLARGVVRFNRTVARLIRDGHIEAVWVRSIPACALVAGAAKATGRPLVLDLGVEKRSRGVRKILDQAALASADVVVAEAEGLFEWMFGRRSSTRFRHKLKVIHFGVDADRVEEIARAKRAASARAGPSETVQILCVGTIQPRKNQRLLIDALAMLPESMRARLRVALLGGVADTEYQRVLEERVTALGLDSTVRFLGFREDVPEMLARSDLFAFPTANEGVPHAVQEAMHAGLPVVATAAGGLPALVRNGVTGLLADPNPEAFARALRRLIETPQLAERMGRRGQELVEQEFSASRWADEYRALLVEVTDADGEARSAAAQPLGGALDR